MAKEVFRSPADYSSMSTPLDYGRLLVISLGTGSEKQEHKYSAQAVAKWGLVSWLIQGNSVPIIDVFNQANRDMVDYFLSVIFQTLNSPDNYLRVQVRSSIFELFKIDFWIIYLQFYILIASS